MAKRIRVPFELIDRYLLGEPVSKAELVSRLLAERDDDPRAAPFYRALESVGVRAADEAFVALRIVLAGHAVTDERVRSLRAASNAARLGRHGDRAALLALVRREPSLAGLVPDETAPLGEIAHAAAERYRAEVAASRK